MLSQMQVTEVSSPRQNSGENKIKSFLRPYWRSLKELIRSLKVLLIKPLQYLPVSSEIIGPPKGVYESTQQWLADNESDIVQGSYTEIYPSQSIQRSEPKTLDKDIHWKYKVEYQRKLPASFVVAVPKGRIWVNNGPIADYHAAIATDDRLLSDLSLDFGRLPHHHSIFKEWKLPPVHHIQGTAAALTSAKANIYFHWMFDLLPRVELLRRSGIALDEIDQFIVNSYKSPFQQETLTTLGIPPNKITESSKYPHVKAERLLIPSLPAMPPGNPPLWVCNFLRQEFLANEATKKTAPLERIYISRNRSSYRHVLNEAEVTTFLEKLGFINIALESIPVAEQALLFASAKVVVAPHGAGMTNTVFCQPGTKVIEFFSPKYVNVCYWSLANQIGLDYYYFIGEGEAPPEGVDPHLAGDDILVKLESLSKTLNLAGVR